jgi:hypothetical protein
MRLGFFLVVPPNRWLVLSEGCDTANLLLGKCIMSTTVNIDPEFTLMLAPGSDSGLDGSDNITNVKAPTFIGRAAPGATVYIVNNQNYGEDGKTTADSEGNWIIVFDKLTDPNNSGYNLMSGSASSGGQKTMKVFVDTSQPTVSVTSATPGVARSSVPVQSNEAGKAFLIKESEVIKTYADILFLAASGRAAEYKEIALHATSSNTEFEADIPFGDLAEGAYRVYAVDSAGNLSEPSYSAVTIDRTAPAASAPDLWSIYDSGISNSDNITNVDTDLAFFVVVAQENTVKLYEKFEDIAYLSPLIVDTSYTNSPNGWLVKIPGKIAAGPHTLVTRVTDLAGNYVAFTGPASTSPLAMSFTIDTTGPDAPVIATTPFTNNYSATAKSDDTARIYVVRQDLVVTSLASITDEKTAEPSKVSMVQVADSSKPVELPLDTLATGNYVAYAMDVAGNISAIPASGIAVDHDVPNLADFTRPAAGSYRTGSTLSFTANVSEAVYLDINSPPILTLQVGTQTREATYATGTYDAGNGDTALVFNYTVQAGDNDADGISILALNDGTGSTLQDSKGNALNKSLATLDTATGALVDTVAPTLVSCSIQGPVNAESSRQATFQFSEALKNFRIDNIEVADGTISNLVDAGDHINYTAIFTPTASDNNFETLLSIVVYTDLAGNRSSTGLNGEIAISGDTLRPAIVSITPVGSPAGDVTSLSFAVEASEAVNSLSTTDFLLATVRHTTADIIEVTGSGGNYLVKVGNIRGDGTLRLDVQPNRLMDIAGNVMKDSYTSGTLHDVFFPEPFDPLVRFSLIDGVTVKSTTILSTTSATGTGGGKVSGAATSSMSVDIAPVNNSTRIEDAGSTSAATADIPLSFSNSSTQGTILTVSLPDGIGLRADGSLPMSNADAVAQLTTFITGVSSQYLDSGKIQMVDGAKHFLEQAALAEKKQVVAEKVMLTTNALSAPAIPITVSGNAAAGNDAPAQALLIDATRLAKDTVINLENVDFSVLIGSATLDIQGKSAVYAGDGDQIIRLGASGGEAHGGAGNDTLRGRNGNDKIFGDAGDDTLDGGAGRDLICGGSGFDTAIYTGLQSNYTIERNGSIFTVRSLSDPTNADTLVNVESIRFADRTISLEYGFSRVTTPEFIAGLYAALLGQAPDIAGLQNWSEQLASSGGKMRDIAAKFASTTNFEEQYSPMLSSAEFVGELYHRILGIEGDAMSRQYWTGKLDEGMRRTEVLADMVAGTLNYNARATAVTRAELLDAAEAWNMFSNKVAVGLHYAAVMGDSANGDVNSAAYKQSVDVLSGVTDNSQSVEDALLKIDIIGRPAGSGGASLANALS